jgi:hypothetical protein
MHRHPHTRRGRQTCRLRVLSCLALAGTTLVATAANADTATEEAVTPLPAPAAVLPSLPKATASATIHVEEAAGTPAPAPPADHPTTNVNASESRGLVDQRFLSGFRLGYLYVAESTKPVEAFGGESLSQRVGMRSPHQFLIGYEGFYRMVGHSWLNVILTGNVMASGMEQSKFYPSANALIGFEFHNSFQLGVGVNVTPLKDNQAHTIFAAGWTPQAGNFYVPFHFFFVPDVDGVHRMGVTTGVTW